MRSESDGKKCCYLTCFPLDCFSSFESFFASREGLRVGRTVAELLPVCEDGVEVVRLARGELGFLEPLTSLEFLHLPLKLSSSADCRGVSVSVQLLKSSGRSWLGDLESP